MKQLRRRLGGGLLTAAMVLGLMTGSAWAKESPLAGFTDVAPGAWYAQGVEFVLEQGLMNGVSQTEFAPEGTLTRAMAAQLIWALAGHIRSDLITYGDTDWNAWYAPAVSWVSEKGLMNGYAEGRFGPDRTMTREQVALTLYRYADLYRYDTRLKGDLSAFADGDTVSSWARDAMTWAVGCGLLSGGEGSRLFPGDPVTRGEMAQILMKFQQLYQD